MKKKIICQCCFEEEATPDSSICKNCYEAQVNEENLFLDSEEIL